MENLAFAFGHTERFPPEPGRMQTGYGLHVTPTTVTSISCRVVGNLINLELHNELRMTNHIE